MFLLKYVIAQQVIVKTIKYIIMQPLVEYRKFCEVLDRQNVYVDNVYHFVYAILVYI